MAGFENSFLRPQKETFWKPTKVQHLYRHRNGRYYVRTYAAGKENWQSLRSTLLSVAKNRMKESLEAAEKARNSAPFEKTTGPLLFRDALSAYRQQLETSVIQPATRSFRDAGLKLVMRSWEDIEETNVRKITPQIVCRWIGEFQRNARPYVPHRAKSPARHDR